jgi:hypothetical protein
VLSRLDDGWNGHMGDRIGQDRTGLWDCTVCTCSVIRPSYWYEYPDSRLKILVPVSLSLSLSLSPSPSPSRLYGTVQSNLGLSGIRMARGMAAPARSLPAMFTGSIINGEMSGVRLRGLVLE